MQKFAQPRNEKDFTLPRGSNHESPEWILQPEELVREILSNENSIFEKRVQAIAFAAELEWLADENSSIEGHLSSATYQRAPRGIYSEDIRRGISEVEDIYSRVAYSQGHRTRKWDASNVTKVGKHVEGPKEKAFETVDRVSKAASGVSDDNLMSWCLSIDNVSGLDTGEKIDLERVSDYL